MNQLLPAKGDTADGAAKAETIDPVQIWGEPAAKLLQRLGTTPAGLTAAEAAARLAFLSFGKGRHPAGLNFGGCMSYALATATGEPLLFKGPDFVMTDVRVA